MSKVNRSKVFAAFRIEMKLARDLEDDHRYRDAFKHYERAHILGQRWFLLHWRTHWCMMRLAWVERNRAELLGQFKRLLAVPIGWITGWVPRGNTGGSNVSALRPMELPEDLNYLLDNYSVWRDVGLRVTLILLIVVALSIVARQ